MINIEDVDYIVIKPVYWEVTAIKPLGEIGWKGYIKDLKGNIYETPEYRVPWYKSLKIIKKIFSQLLSYLQ